jgi:indolepyruvate ferredoxin oxidoreductase, beta subunit
MPAVLERSHGKTKANDMKKDIIIVGVGGQGILMSSKILGMLALHTGHDVKVSEVHGMSQRGGSVITHVRIGDHLESPLIVPGEADIVVSFEWLEAQRAQHFLKNQGIMITNTARIALVSGGKGAAEYPEGQPVASTVIAVNAQEIAKRCGNVRSVNIVLLGTLSRFMDWPETEWIKAISQCVPQKALAVNISAFSAGREGQSAGG